MLKSCANFAGSNYDFLFTHYLISIIKSEVSTGDTTISVLIDEYAWKMNGNERGVTCMPLDMNTHPTQKPYSALVEGLTRYLPRYLPNFQKADKARGKISEDTPTGLTNLKVFLSMAQKALLK
jgi:hypothetical protein